MFFILIQTFLLIKIKLFFEKTNVLSKIDY